MKVQFHFAIDDSPKAFGQAVGLMVGFALSLDISDSPCLENTERALVDDLIPRIKFRGR